MAKCDGKGKNALSDQELIVHYAKEGNSKCIKEIFDRYHHIIFLRCQHYLKDEEESKDASFEIFEKMLEDFKRYEIANFRSWLYQVVRNHCLKRLELGRRLRIADVDVENLANSFMENPENYSLNNEESNTERLDQLHDALEQLNDAQRTCLKLFYYEKKSYKDIAVITGFTVKHVKSHIQNGRRNLKRIMGER